MKDERFADEREIRVVWELKDKAFAGGISPAIKTSNLLSVSL